jgi:hypothetical protein
MEELRYSLREVVAISDNLDTGLRDAKDPAKKKKGRSGVVSAAPFLFG